MNENDAYGLALPAPPLAAVLPPELPCGGPNNKTAQFSVYVMRHEDMIEHFFSDFTILDLVIEFRGALRPGNKVYEIVNTRFFMGLLAGWVVS